METVVLDGKEYTKASVVAKRFQYTADYLGQLCRGKKVDARVVGRTWFVHIPSLEQHRQQKYANLRKETDVKTVDNSIAPTSDMGLKKYTKRVQMPLRSVSKTIHFSSTTPPAKEQHLSVKYESDDTSLVPKINKVPKVTLLKINPADSEKLTVRASEQKHATLLPEPLPEVYLRGKVQVTDIPDEDMTEIDLSEEKSSTDSIRDNKENKEETEPTTELSIDQKTPRKLKVTIKKLDVQAMPKPAGTPVQRDTNSAPVRPVRSPSQKPQYSPVPVAVTNIDVVSERGSTIPITVSFGLSVVAAVMLLSLENIIVASASTFDSSIVFQASVFLSKFSF